MKSAFGNVLLVVSFLLQVCSAHAAQDILTVTPEDNHEQINSAIDKAQSSIEMVMFHLSDLESVDHLIGAQKRGVQVRIILDEKLVQKGSAAQIKDHLVGEGVDVRSSPPGFSITHEKAMVIDKKTALISSINLTRNGAFTRDFGIFTSDTGVINEMGSVFESDWSNSSMQLMPPTPQLSNDRLAWSPVNSKEKILALLDSAKKSISLEVENLGSAEIIAMLQKKSHEGIAVTVLVPLCVEGGMDQKRNVPFLKNLAASGVKALAAVSPYTAENPYIHAKAIVVDSQAVFVGSENLSHNSLDLARELGIIERQPDITAKVESIIKADFRRGISGDALDSTSCN
nr:phospholipase D-like domain-containing protein [uncultured Bdellovibrio sp.]